jgi:hypothetical protein
MFRKLDAFPSSSASGRRILVSWVHKKKPVSIIGLGPSNGAQLSKIPLMTDTYPASETLCTSNMPQTKDNVQNNVDVKNRPLSQIFRETLQLKIVYECGPQNARVLQVENRVSHASNSKLRFCSSLGDT